MTDVGNAHKFYEDLDSLFHNIINTLNIFGDSQILQNYFFGRFESLVYANLINNFFKNLTKKNIAELGLSHDKITEIRKGYETLQKNVKLALSLSSYYKISEEDYLGFKSDLNGRFPDFLKIILEIEKMIPVDEVKQYLAKKRKEIEKSGKDQTGLEDILITKVVEVYVSKHKRFPAGFKFGKSLKTIAIKSLQKLSEEMIKNLEKDRPRMLKEHKKIRKGFEDRLYKTWREPFDLFESLIVVCMESGEEKKDKLSNGKNITNPKQVALIKIHARAIQIAYEILSLVKSGYADGAHARWRSLHELAIITFFLRENNEEVAERYLEHAVMKKFREAGNYLKHHKKLKYPPINKKNYALLKKEHDRLLKKYGNDFEYRSGFEWIPRTILANRTFKSLEEHVKLEKFYPFYSWSSDSMHGGAKGLHRIGLIDDYQEQVLAVGATDYGFADPIQNTVISITHVTSNLLLLKPNFEDLLIMQVLQKYLHDIGEKAVKTQRNVEKQYELRMKSLFDEIEKSGILNEYKKDVRMPVDQKITKEFEKSEN
jgi:hypothetical protein